jgi:hypothetical protein
MERNTIEAQKIKKTEYEKLMRITKEHHYYIMNHRKGRQSAAGFLKYIINRYIENEMEIR